MSRKSERGDAHKWHALDNYVHVHDRRLEDFQHEGFVLDHSLSFRRIEEDRLFLQGRVWRRGKLFIDVETHLDVRTASGRRQVRIVKYSFHAGVEGAQDRAVFRYDNFHAYSREGHPDAHHKHVYDHATWRERTPPEWVGETDWPLLSDVIEELRQWWETTGQFLNLGRSDNVAPSERQ